MVYINDEYHFIFIENPKSGSTSILKALEKSLDIKIKREMFPQVAHITCHQIKTKYPDKWKNYFKVSTYRDPFKRFCSSVNFNLHKFNKGLEHHLSNNKNCVYCLPQWEFVKDCNFIIKVENIQNDYDEFCKRVGISTADVEKYNSSKKKVYSDKYLESLFKQQ